MFRFDRSLPRLIAALVALCLPRTSLAQGPALPHYERTIFEDTIPPDQLSFLSQYNGAQTRDLVRDKQFKRIWKAAVPGWEFHYGRDMSLSEAMSMMLDGSRLEVQIRDGRYLTAAGEASKFAPHPEGQGFVWVDLKEGIVLGAFYFYPSNGEPTPTVTVFSKQLRQPVLAMSQLPLAFADDLRDWAYGAKIPPITTRYFIGAIDARILLEHTEDFCTTPSPGGGPPAADCLSMNAAAADIDLNTASYLEQVNYRTNATAWMINGADQTAFLQLRESACGLGALDCRIRLTRERTQVIVHRAPVMRTAHR